MSPRVRYPLVVSDRYGWHLTQYDTSRFFVRMTDGIEMLLGWCGHPCCGAKLGRIRCVRDAAQRLLRWADMTAGRHTQTVATVAISPHVAALLVTADRYWTADVADWDSPERAAIDRRTPTPAVLRSWSADEVLRWLAAAKPNDVRDTAQQLRLGPEFEKTWAWWRFCADSWEEASITPDEALDWIGFGADTAEQAQVQLAAGFRDPWDWWRDRQRPTPSGDPE